MGVTLDKLHIIMSGMKLGLLGPRATVSSTLLPEAMGDACRYELRGRGLKLYELIFKVN